MIKLSAEELHKIIPLATIKNIALYLGPLNQAMEEFEINTPIRIAAFLAQVAHESENLLYVEEIASGSAYEYREDLGNLKSKALTIAHSHGSTTGHWFRGKGLIQITGYNNFLACGKALEIDCLNKPRLLKEPVNAARSAAWYWVTHDCNEHIDKGDFDACTKAINGGYRGKDKRDTLFANAKKILQC
jgi:putative chitinase